MKNKKEFLEVITRNIQAKQFHITVVAQSKTPRYAYSVGNYDKYGFELVLAGSENFLYEDVLLIFNDIVSQLENEIDIDTKMFLVKDLGNFHLREISDSRKTKMMFGVYDYYEVNNFRAYQIIPEKAHYTLDIPNMNNQWNSNNDIIWKWLDDSIKWDLDVPEESTVITEIDVLLGKKATEIMRWEKDDWQIFTQDGNNIDEDNLRVVPITTILGIDETLLPIIKLNLGKGLWRSEDELIWNDWG
ncbi:DUF4262 domain-containing protein [Chryseobacterium vrystaatense]|uniref:DUF4262 domain-containing protein n=1 Tax=Chryseobacterium vrystaatense TaxID=307480 RepID=A0A1M4YXK6_9FLAO|nr:DUF4262 domain-containing protein [Chryseobacterium vrystaatense]SHF10539.1 hypothetical protein SAMN02787073_1412 [Chryseobacterium vrystaatense]